MDCINPYSKHTALYIRRFSLPTIYVECPKVGSANSWSVHNHQSALTFIRFAGFGQNNFELIYINYRMCALIFSYPHMIVDWRSRQRGRQWAISLASFSWFLTQNINKKNGINAHSPKTWRKQHEKDQTQHLSIYRILLFILQYVAVAFAACACVCAAAAAAFLFVSNACVHSSILLLPCRFFVWFCLRLLMLLEFVLVAVEFIIVSAQCIECGQQQQNKAEAPSSQSTEATLEFKSVYFKIFALLQMEKNKNLILQSAPLWSLHISLAQHVVRLHSSHSRSVAPIMLLLQFDWNVQQWSIWSKFVWLPCSLIR